MRLASTFTVLLSLFLHSTNADACNRDERQLVCPGDRVVAKNYVQNKSWGGRVEAVNPFRNTVAVLHDDYDRATWNLSDVAVGVGCIQGYCVGDRAVARNGGTNKSWGGRIVAVNPWRQEVAIMHDDYDLATWSLDDVSLGLGCIEGYCVGDRAVATNSTSGKSWGGKIVAVNPSRRMISILHDDYDLATWDIADVANAEFCADYDSLARKHHRFPLLNESRFRVKKWKYGLNR